MSNTKRPVHCPFCCHRLEVVADPSGLVSKVLEVLGVCTPGVQAQLVGLLPEVVAEEEQEVRQG